MGRRQKNQLKAANCFLSHRWKGFSCLGQTIRFLENTLRKTMQRQSYSLRSEGTAFAFRRISGAGPTLEASLWWREATSWALKPEQEDLQDKSESNSSKALTFSNPSGTNLYYIDTLLFSLLLLSFIKSCRLGPAMLRGIKGNDGPTQGMKWFKGWQCGHYIKMIIFSIDRLFKGNQQQKFWQCLTRKNR